MKRFLLTAALFSSLMSPALAQQQEPLMRLTDPDVSIGVLGMRVYQAEGVEIYDMDGNAIGTVLAVLGQSEKTPTALAVEMNGRSVVLELASMELVNNRIVVQMDGGTFEGLPAWEQ
ncbi:hypothetical protein SAMN05216456_1261 [Devosia crocina]|uniref:PRC-barrel domain-containing protein n=1 Tax=Devosia crocina TaxID=429728 RepID=A0A1I7N947_9HYPH|nr:hypothetical protein [Devosia crocina]SFV31190.1 hypothetical protein SAMN05216456_1261 [Devosia crocina]